MAFEEVVVTNDRDVSISPELDDDVVVQVDTEADTINVPEQGPPGPPGAPGVNGTNGNTILYGGSDPITSQGKDGDSYINTTTHFIFGPKSGGLWPPGASLVGPPGPRGNSVLYGTGAPSSGVGVDGDFYIDQATHVMYGPKAGGAWPAGVSLIGPQGPQGTPGAGGVPGTRGSLFYMGAGPPGAISGQANGDSYLNTTNGDVYSLISGTWTLQGNIRGPVGPTGPSITYISDTPPAGVPDNTLWWCSLDGQLYLRYNDGTSTQWVQACPMPDVSNFVKKSGDTMTGPLVLPADPTTAMQAATKQYADALVGVRYDIAQALTLPQTEQARKNIFAAPYDAEAYMGMQINGGHVISQVLGSSGIAIPNGGNVYVSDQWQVAATSGVAGFGSAQQPGGPNGLINSLYLNANPAVTSIAAGDFAFMQQPIEGYRWARLAWGVAGAYPVTISFFVFATRTGTAHVCLRNALTNRSYVVPFTINAANTWEFKQITVPADTTGTWEKTTNVGCYISFVFMCGTTLQTGSPNNWNANGTMATAAQTNFFPATTDGVYVTGVHCVPGNEGPPADRAGGYLTRFREDELRLCQRYLARFDDGATDFLMGQCFSATQAMIPWRFHVPMRIGPAHNSGGAFQLRSAGSSGINITGLSFSASFPNVGILNAITAGSLLAGNATAIILNSGAYLQAHARY